MSLKQICFYDTGLFYKNYLFNGIQGPYPWSLSFCAESTVPSDEVFDDESDELSDESLDEVSDDVSDGVLEDVLSAGLLLDEVEDELFVLEAEPGLVSISMLTLPQPSRASEELLADDELSVPDGLDEVSVLDGLDEASLLEGLDEPVLLPEFDDVPSVDSCSLLRVSSPDASTLCSSLDRTLPFPSLGTLTAPLFSSCRFIATSTITAANISVAADIIMGINFFFKTITYLF